MKNFEKNNNLKYRRVSQIDLVPTLSLLLGIPIPFGNIGGIIPELFLNTNFDNIQEIINYINNTNILNEENLTFIISSLQKTNIALHINNWQIFNYLQTYSKISREFSNSKLNQLNLFFENTNKLFEEILKDTYFSNNNELKKNLLKHIQIFQKYR